MELLAKYIIPLDPRSRSPHGERGLKYLWPRFLVQAYPGRSPHGERGLKFIYRNIPGAHDVSLPPRGAWIEIKIKGVY